MSQIFFIRSAYAVYHHSAPLIFPVSAGFAVDRVIAVAVSGHGNTIHCSSCVSQSITHSSFVLHAPWPTKIHPHLFSRYRRLPSGGKNLNGNGLLIKDIDMMHAWVQIVAFVTPKLLKLHAQKSPAWSKDVFEFKLRERMLNGLSTFLINPFFSDSNIELTEIYECIKLKMMIF